MAYLNISLTEAIGFIDKNINYNRDRIKSIKLINGSQTEITVSVGKFFPDMKVVVAFNGYRDGRLYFNIITKGGIKILMGLMNELGGKNLNDYIRLEKDMVQVDVNKFTGDNFKDVKVRDISMSGEQIYVTIDFN
ncbi:hypothetical protein [Clostridium thermarum]|uniref:hypothetical protein n=1 Tax=Clostridium thermarum TaxID=1716543 RepID=UPI0011202BF6|nr:hypothetical protein [Clostridium thermarum]